MLAGGPNLPLMLTVGPVINIGPNHVSVADEPVDNTPDDGDDPITSHVTIRRLSAATVAKMVPYYMVRKQKANSS